MAGDPLREEQIESRWEAAPAVVLVIAFQLVLALVSRKQDWTLWELPWWVLLIPVGPEVALLIPLAWDRPRHRLEQIGLRRTVVLALIAVVGLSNGLLLAALLASLITGHETSGGELLFKGAAIWGTNVIAFGLSFWALDRGGPVERLRSDRLLPDFRSRRTRTRNSRSPAGDRVLSTTSTSRSPTRSRSARPTRCRLPAPRSC